MEGFFSEGEVLSRQPLSMIPLCGKCGLYKGCKSPKMPPTGEGKKGILIVGEAPGEEEDERNKQFIGKSGRFLRDTLEEFGIAPNRDCHFTNALICRPPNNIIKSENWIDYCRPNIINTIDRLQPRVIILFGASAVKSVIKHAWGDEPLPLQRWIGQIIPSQKLNAWICPTWHPAYLLRLNDRVVDRFWREHIKKALSPLLKLPPFRKQPTYNIHRGFDGGIPQIESLMNNTKVIAFDFETNMIKPDSEQARIITCAISDGKSAVAFPWMKKTQKIMKEILEDPKIYKRGYNMKFEQRWARRNGIKIRGWQLDSMLAAHTLDNRPETKSLNFQMFVRLGYPIYDSHIKPYLKSQSPGGVNRIHEIDLGALLDYNGLDALIEYQLADHFIPLL